VLIAIPAWNYYARRLQKSASPKVGAKLPSGVSVRTEGFTYSRTEGGHTQFTVHANQSLGYKDDKYLLQDVDVVVYGASERDPQRNIRGKNCAIDQATNDFTCNGNVEVQLDDHTVVRTDYLIYNHRTGTVVAPQRATLEQNGTSGHADKVEYVVNTGVLKLTGNVNIQTADNIEVETAAAVFQQKENWTTMSGGVFIKSKTGWIRGSTARADLEPDTYKPKMINVDGNVTAESRSQAGSDLWKLRAGSMEAIVSRSGVAERVRTRGNVEMEKFAGDTQQRLSGGEIDTTLRDGKVESLLARQNARMVLGSDQTLESAQIWTNVTGSVQTTGKSVLKVGDSTIEGNDFLIQSREDLVTFSTVKPATVKKDDQESSSDQMRARFASSTNMLLELVQNGNFHFRTPQYEGHAQNGRFEEGGTIVTLEGSPVVNDSEKSLQAAQIRVNQKDNSFVATKNVSTLMKNPTERVLVKAARAEGGADAMLYTGNVQLWRGDTYIKAERLTASGQGQQNSHLHAEAGPGGKVESYLKNIRATSDTLDYNDSDGVIRYLGQVHARKQDMILETPDLTVHFRDGNVSEIVASGGVTVTRLDQRGTGERAVYDASTDLVTLTGKNAQVRDKERLVEGPTMIMKNKGQAVSVVGGNGERTTTKHPVKTDKK
jgi:lipopolysaccharide export system protein LptA